MSTNPLKQFARTPKIYVRLPTLNRFYAEEIIEAAPNGEIPVKAMTASDDLLMKNPDALLNGDAVFQALKSCVPNVKDVKKLLVPDVYSLLLGLRYASYGDKMIYKVKCPKCGAEHEEKVSIRQLLDYSRSIEDFGDNVYTITHGDDAKVAIHIMPSPYLDVTNANLMIFEQTRMMQYLAADDEISTQERNEKMKEAYDKLAAFNIQVLINSIEKVDIIQMSGEEEVKTSIKDRNHITEFVRDLEKDHSDSLNKMLESLNEIGPPKTVNVVCDSCQHEYEMEVRFDPVNFSAQTFSGSPVKKSQNS